MKSELTKITKIKKMERRPSKSLLEKDRTPLKVILFKMSSKNSILIDLHQQLF